MLLLARVLLVLGLLTCCLALRAQYVQVSTNPSSLLFGVLKLEAEVPFDHNFAFEPEIAYLTPGRRFWTADYDTEGVRFGATFKKYFDAEAAHRGWYGMAYLRNSRITFTDFSEEGEERDQRDFRRLRATFGLGVGYTDVGRDGFVYGFSLGVGRHFTDRKDYTSPPLDGPNGRIFDSDDSEIFDLPIDVYGRVYVGVRIFNPEGRAVQDAIIEREKAEETELRERLQRREEALGGQLRRD